MTIKELYPILAQLMSNAESITWNRLYNFLTCNSILLLAWATICAANPTCAGKAAMWLLCLVGGISGIAWMELGRRGRMYIEFYGNYAKRLEGEANLFDPGVSKGFAKVACSQEEVWPFQFEVDGPWFGKSKHILRWLPLVFTGLYALLAVITYYA